MTSRTRRVVAVGASVALAYVALTGCGTTEKYAEPWKDAPRGGTFDGPADVVTMPDGFNNLATKCGPGGMRYTVIYHGNGPYGAVSVTPDPTCAR